MYPFSLRSVISKNENTVFGIESGILPPKEGFDVLNSYEKEFFQCFKQTLIDNELDPDCITLTRLASWTFNVNAKWCYVGKIRLRPKVTPDKYVVVKPSNKRPLKVFLTEEEASAYSESKFGSKIEFRKGSATPFSMQILTGTNNVKEPETHSLQKCIDAIPKWVKYIKRCKCEYESILELD